MMVTTEEEAYERDFEECSHGSSPVERADLGLF